MEGVFLVGEGGVKREREMMYLVHKWSTTLDWPFCIRSNGWKYYDELNILLSSPSASMSNAPR